jgi:hypothetical protein
VAAVAGAQTFAVGEPEFDDPPERKLARAVIEAALFDAEHSQGINGSSARKWLTSDAEHAYSFRSLCELLGIDWQRAHRRMVMRFEKAHRA